MRGSKVGKKKLPEVIEERQMKQFKHAFRIVEERKVKNKKFMEITLERKVRKGRSRIKLEDIIESKG